MCWDCDNPGGDYVEEVVRPNIERYGWHVTGVYGGRNSAPFAYTVGLTLHGLPELLVTGLRLERGATLLNHVGHQLLLEGPVEHGQRLRHGGRDVEVVELPHPEAHLFTAVEAFGEVRAQQLVHSDDRGHWPWDRGYRSGRGGQPVLGPRAEHRRSA
ncbi:MAG: hypothetical protein JWO60_2023 [Frankiales bacterium]|nr:hypothetical protein [Frankiales bacterium]